MPKRLVDRKESAKNSRRIVYVTPHSPWQQMIDARRIEKQLTWREMDELVECGSGVAWQWVHNQNGFPHPKSCKPKHIRNLAKALKIPLSPAPSIDAFATFIAALENDKRVYVSRSYVLGLAKRLHAGAKAAESPLPPGK